MKRITAIVLCLCLFLSGCGETQVEEGLGNGWEPVSTMQLQFAHEFSVDYYTDGYKLITLGDGSRFLVIPEGGALPRGISRDIKPLYQPIENMYLAATSAMCLFDSMERLDAIRLSGTQEDGWYIDNARAAMQQGDILYAGKFSDVRQSNQDTAIITHGGVIAAIMAHLFPEEKKNRYQWQPKPGCGYQICGSEYHPIP